MTRTLWIGIAAAVATLTLAPTAFGWKGPTHLFAAEHALLDVQDGSMVIPDASGDPAKAVTVPAHGLIAEALRRYPDAYRAGVIGPDAFPDLVTGQTLVHPETGDSITDEWLAYLWEQAWRPSWTLFATDTPVNDDERMRAISFATGFLAGHAAGDMWAHTMINAPDFAAGVFPSLSEDLENARIAVKHVVIEAYIEKHTPGYEPIAPRTYSLDAPDAFVATTLVMSDFAQSHGRHPVLGPFVDRYEQLHRERRELLFDREHQDCIAPSAGNCTEVPHDGHVHHVCVEEGCIGNPLDAPINVLELPGNLATVAFLEAWLEDLEDGIVGYITMSERIAREMHTGKHLDRAEIVDAVNDWVYGHALSMLGLPDFVGDGVLWTQDVLETLLAPLVLCTGPVWTDARQDEVFGSFFEGACDLHDLLEEEVTELAEGVADELLGGLLTHAFGLHRIDPHTFGALDLNGNGALAPFELLNLLENPVGYLADRRLFAEGNRALIDAHMGLTAGSDDDAAGRYRPFAPDDFPAFKNSQVLAQLGMLAAPGLNDLVRAKASQVGDGDALADLYGAYVNPNTGEAPQWSVPTNVMLGWIRSLDGDHQWRTSSLFPVPDAPPPAPPGDAPAVWFTAETGVPRPIGNGLLDRSGGIGSVTVSGTVSEARLPGFDGTPRLHGGPKHLTLAGGGVVFTGAVLADGCCNWSLVASYSGGWAADKPDDLRIRPTGIVTGPGGTVYFTDVGRNAIGTFSGGSYGEIPLPGPGRIPRGIAVGPDGNIWFVEQGGNRVGRLAGGTITEFPIPIPNSQPIGIAAGPNGALWFTMNGAFHVGRITTDGEITTYPAPGLNGQGITAGPDGAMWYVATGASKVVRISMTGALTSWTIPNTGTSVAPTPVEIALGGDGNLWFTQKGDHEIGRITPSGVITEFPLDQLSSPYGIVGAPPIAVEPPSPPSTVHGTGRMWLWEDCVSRRTVFRTIFREPVLGHVAFADDGDPWTALTDTVAPSVALEPDGPTAVVDGTTYAGPGTSVRAEAVDDFHPADLVELTVAHGPAGEPLGGGEGVANPYVVPLAGTDGPYSFRASASDACGNAAAPAERTFVLDTTPPDVKIVEPAAEAYESDDVVDVEVSATDAGAGVDAVTTTLAGAPLAGGTIDAFFLAPGTYELAATARDHVGNTARAVHAFEVQASAESLRANVERALSLALISDADVADGLTDKLDAADASHDAGRHSTEANQLRAFVNQLRAQRGKAIDAATADRLIAYAEELRAARR